MKQTLVIFWLWGFAITAYACYCRMQYQGSHLERKSALSQVSVQNQFWMPKGKFSD